MSQDRSHAIRSGSQPIRSNGTVTSDRRLASASSAPASTAGTGIAGSSTLKRDIVVTWPKTKPLAEYIKALGHARSNDELINFRVANLPPWPAGSFALGGPLVRCYHVHDGFVRGWCRVIYATTREVGEVEGWPAGLYVVRDPHWHPCKEIPMRGFRGWRWFDRSQVA